MNEVIEDNSGSFEFLEKLAFLFTPARWKVAYGGRGAGKTEGFSMALILLSRTKKLRILCCREFQNSIDESVKQTIEAQIESMGLSEEFQILGKQIVNKVTGSRFFFMGLRYNINKVKSLGRIDVAWSEESDKLSKTTLDKLSPTIRGRSKFEADKGGPFGEGPEIWISYNPDLDDDEVHKRFVVEKHIYAPDYVIIDNNDEVVLNKEGKIAAPSADEIVDPAIGKKVRYCIVEKVNYWDNKWFPPDLRMEMAITKAASETKYLEVWEGNTKQVLEGAIYADEIRTVLKERRKKHVPYDPTRVVYTFWDLGHSDKTAIWFIQRVGLEYNIIDYYQNNLKKLGHYLLVMQERGYQYGTVFQPHDADNETLASRSIKKMTQDAGYTVRIVPRPVKKILGINASRTIFPLCNFDESKTADGWQCLARYAYKVNEETGAFSREPEHDTPWSHGADAFQTFALSLKSEDDTKKPAKTDNREKILSLSRQSNNAWMS